MRHSITKPPSRPPFRNSLLAATAPMLVIVIGLLLAFAAYVVGRWLAR
jgi:hypothetical protein